MSAHELPVILSPRAEEDVRSILLYTEGQWGADQRHRYRVLLYNAMDSLSAFPYLGRERPEHFPGCRSLPVAQHVMYYRVTDSEIFIVRFLHASQDASGEVLP